MLKRTSWWNTKYGKDSLCPISRTRLRPGKNKHGTPFTLKLDCGHYFGRNAIVLWYFSGNHSCPMCRKEFTIL